jgi:UPF0176 protein
MSVEVVALYAFIPIANTMKLRDDIDMLSTRCLIMGALIIASEGINGTVAGSKENMEIFLQFFADSNLLSFMNIKRSSNASQPFHRMRISIKNEIVTMGVLDLNISKRGKYVSAKNWNKLITEPDIVLLDTRNDYEIEIGSFASAVNPSIKTFREFPAYVEQNIDALKGKKVAMFCTGGIRCEKASSYLLNRGIEDVYHLEGGILRYFEETAVHDSLWRGECYVFDKRVSVTHDLQPGKTKLCCSCRHPLSEDHLRQPSYEDGVCCPFCSDVLPEEKKVAARERNRQIQLSDARNEKHLGYVHPGHNRYRVGGCGIGGDSI